jgi:hypothetical protein
VTKKMVAAGECDYCHTVLRTEPVAAPPPKPQPQQVVHVTRIEVGGGEAHAGHLFDSVTARVAGCFSGCLSAGITLAVTGMILLFVGWQLWVQARNMPQPPSPSPAPSAEHPRKGRNR